eukprot:jgi/Tetstr1/459398/TSEL_004777.t1
MTLLFRRGSADSPSRQVSTEPAAVKGTAGRASASDAECEDPTARRTAWCGDKPSGRNPKPIRSCYDIGPVIGTGNFSVVRSAIDLRTGARVAVKMFLNGKLPKEESYREIALLQKAQHASVLRFVEYFEDDQGGLFLVTEFMSGRETQVCLTERGSYAEEDCRTMAKQLLLALEHLHRNGIAHRDLKLENIVLGPDDCPSSVKIIDFGLAGQISEDCPHLSRPCGTPVSTAPEVLVQNARYGTSCDIWSLGCLLFTLLSGAPPFGAKARHASLYDLVRDIRRGRYSMSDPAWYLVSDNARDFVQSLLTVEPKARPTASAALLHPWLQE